MRSPQRDQNPRCAAGSVASRPLTFGSRLAAVDPHDPHLGRGLKVRLVKPSAIIVIANVFGTSA